MVILNTILKHQIESLIDWESETGFHSIHDAQVFFKSNENVRLRMVIDRYGPGKGYKRIVKALFQIKIKDETILLYMNKKTGSCGACDDWLDVIDKHDLQKINEFKQELIDRAYIVPLEEQWTKIQDMIQGCIHDEIYAEEDVKQYFKLF